MLCIDHHCHYRLFVHTGNHYSKRRDPIKSRSSKFILRELIKQPNIKSLIKIAIYASITFFTSNSLRMLIYASRVLDSFKRRLKENTPMVLNPAICQALHLMGFRPPISLPEDRLFTKPLTEHHSV